MESCADAIDIDKGLESPDNLFFIHNHNKKKKYGNTMNEKRNRRIWKVNQKVRWQILEDNAQELYLTEWRKRKEEKCNQRNRKKRERVEKIRTKIIG